MLEIPGHQHGDDLTEGLTDVPTCLTERLTDVPASWTEGLTDVLLLRRLLMRLALLSISSSLLCMPQPARQEIHKQVCNSRILTDASK